MQCLYSVRAGASGGGSLPCGSAGGANTKGPPAAAAGESTAAAGETVQGLRAWATCEPSSGRRWGAPRRAEGA